jgi:hypothetical protein
VLLVCYYYHINRKQQDNTMRKLMNLQGQLFTEQQAREHYGDRYETAILEWVEVDEDGEVL